MPTTSPLTSGKSTTLRQFQLHYTPHAFQKEKLLWRAVIQLNLVRSILNVLDALSEAQAESLARQQRIQAQHKMAQQPFAYSLNGEGGGEMGGMESLGMGNGFEGYEGGGLTDMNMPIDDESDDPLFFGEDFEAFKARLEPLRRVEEVLIARLAPHDEDGSGIMRPTKVRHRGRTGGKSGSGGANGAGEVTIRSAVMARLKGRDLSKEGEEKEKGEWDEPTEVIFGCREEMMALWEDQMVREVLKRRKIRVEEGPGLLVHYTPSFLLITPFNSFLDDLERITAITYCPTDDDVLRARLKTVGVTEYRFDMEASAGRESGSEWRIYDVGGSRSQRQTWVPYFDDIDAIIFLAPISAFDQALAEDHSVNRLEDSVLLWKSICSNKLLANVRNGTCFPALVLMCFAFVRLTSFYF